MKYFEKRAVGPVIVYKTPPASADAHGLYIS